MSINELQDEVIAEFSDFDDWMDRYQLLIDLGNEQEPLDEKYKTEQNLIEGCQSRVWLQADEEEGKIVFRAESDALIVKGIIALLIKVLSGHTPEEILAEGASLAHPQQRSAVHGEADTDVCAGLQGQGRRQIKALCCGIRRPDGKRQRGVV